MLTNLKLYLYAALAFVVTALGLSTKYFKDKAEREKRGRKRAEKQLEHASEVIEQDNVIDVEFKSRRADVAQELKEGGNPTVFTNPNSMFDPKDD